MPCFASVLLLLAASTPALTQQVSTARIVSSDRITSWRTSGDPRLVAWAAYFAAAQQDAAGLVLLPPGPESELHHALLSELLLTPESAPPWKSTSFETITWIPGTDLAAAIERRIAAERAALDRTATDLLQHNLLTTAEKGIRPTLLVQTDDQRQDKSTPFPRSVSTIPIAAWPAVASNSSPALVLFPCKPSLLLPC